MKIKNLFLLIFISAIVIEILSYVSYHKPMIGFITIGLVAMLTLIMSLRNIQYGLLCVIAELCLGSQGYLLSFSISNSVISLRMMLWIIVIAVWLGGEVVAVIKRQVQLEKYRDLPYLKPLLALGALILLGLVVGVLRHNDSIFYLLESKRWLYILIIVPLITSFRTKTAIQSLVTTTVAAVIVLCASNLILIYIFSHNFNHLIPDIYTWLRRDVLAEITPSKSGFYRIFIQSQIFILPLITGAYIYWYYQLKKVKNYFNSLSILSFFTVIVGLICLISSLSRSFWVGLVVGLIITTVIHIWIHRPLVRQILYCKSMAIFIIIFSLGLLLALVRFPYPEPRSALDISLLSERANVEEAGAASRWSLLPVMAKEIMRSPLLGYGFGKTLTYKTSDPRIVNSTINGELTTYAFEWGWFDIALKFGLLGLLVFGWLLGQLLQDAYRLMKSEPAIGFVMYSSLIMVIIVHFFTPYLNHPLGFGYVAILIILLQVKNLNKEYFRL